MYLGLSMFRYFTGKQDTNAKKRMSSSEGAPQNSADVWVKVQRFTIWINFGNMSGSVFACVYCFTHCPCACRVVTHMPRHASLWVSPPVMLLGAYLQSGRCFQPDSLCRGGRDRHPGVCLPLQYHLQNEMWKSCDLFQKGGKKHLGM